jgi:hypothetical protein
MPRSRLWRLGYPAERSALRRLAGCGSHTFFTQKGCPKKFTYTDPRTTRDWRNLRLAYAKPVASFADIEDEYIERVHAVVHRGHGGHPKQAALEGLAPDLGG